jgi:hypothetical protein
MYDKGHFHTFIWWAGRRKALSRLIHSDSRLKQHIRFSVKRPLSGKSRVTKSCGTKCLTTIPRLGCRQRSKGSERDAGMGLQRYVTAAQQGALNLGVRSERALSVGRGEGA